MRMAIPKRCATRAEAELATAKAQRDELATQLAAAARAEAKLASAMVRTEGCAAEGHVGLDTVDDMGAADQGLLNACQRDLHERRQAIVRLQEESLESARGVERFVGRHPDSHMKLRFYELVDRLYKRLLLRCECELGGQARAGPTFRAAADGGMQYAPGRLTAEWESYADHEGEEDDSEYACGYARQPAALRRAVPYEHYVASQLLLHYTCNHEGEKHV
jgi:hypothetical protein